MHKDKNFGTEYQKMMNEIVVPEELKRKVSYQAVSHKKKNTIGRLVLAVCMVLVITNMLLGVNAPIKENQINQEKTETEEIPLKTIGNFESLKEIASRIKLENERKEKDSQKNAQESLEDTKEYSSTNLQEKGVDELDIVKTDGKYVYYLIQGSVHIFDIQNSREIQEVGKMEAENRYTIGMYLTKDRLIIINREHETYIKNTEGEDLQKTKANKNSYTNIDIYGMKEVRNPVLERRIEVKGDFLDSRLIGNNVYMITRQFLEKEGMQEEMADEYKPSYRDSIKGNKEQFIEFDKIYQLEDTEDFAYTSIASVDIAKKDEVNVTTFLGMGQNMYCSLNNLYIIKENRSFEDMTKSEVSEETNSTIYKLALKDSKVKFVAQTEVKGRILNQFSMGEYQGFFRIATTTTKEKTSNNIYVFDGFMEQVGKLENIAEGENIYAARFIENTCYLVTFKEIDPFFIIDLSQVTTPEIKGELKIPGYSSYLQSYDEKHILGIGYEVNSTKTGPQQGGVKLTMFDVSDKNNPKEMFTQVIGKQGTYSDATYNHKALLLDKEKQIIGFPITLNNGKNAYFRGAMIYTIDEEKGFVEKGKILHEESSKDYTTTIERILYVGDNIITVSQRYIKIHDKNTMEELGSFRQENVKGMLLE